VTARRSLTLPRALGRLRVALEGAYLRASEEVGLSPVYAELLCAAMTSAPVGRLARDLRCDRTNITRLVDRAVARGWVERSTDESDKRRSLVGLTADGEQLARRFIATLEGQLADLLGYWEEDRKQEAIADITAIAEALEAPPRFRHAARSGRYETSETAALVSTQVPGAN
jgi:DNA-binding MarR family transcriptional regulator